MASDVCTRRFSEQSHFSPFYLLSPKKKTSLCSPAVRNIASYLVIRIKNYIYCRYAYLYINYNGILLSIIIITTTKLRFIKVFIKKNVKNHVKKVVL